MHPGHRSLPGFRNRNPESLAGWLQRVWRTWPALAGLTLAIGLFLATVLLEAGARTPDSSRFMAWANTLAAALGWLACAIAGAVVAWKRRDNPVGWLMLVAGLAWLGGIAAERYVVRPGPPPGSATIAAGMDSFGWVAGLGAIGLLLLLFPTGRPSSHRWRPIGWAIAGAASMLAMALLLTPGPIPSFPFLENPFGVHQVRNVVGPVGDFGRIVFFLGFWAAIASVFIRYRASEGIERQQLKWLGFGVALMAGAFLLGGAAPWFGLEESLFNAIALTLFPPAVIIAMLRYRLWDLDLAVSATVQYLLLAAGITAVYIGFVAGIGLLVGGGSRSEILLVVLATAVAAVLLQPAREAAQRVARGLVYRPAPDLEPAPLRIAIRTLGLFRVERNGVPLGRSEWQSRKARQLLKMLIARRAQPIHREQLVEALWPDDPASNLANRLAVAVSTLRNVLDPEKSFPADHYVLGDEDTLRLNLAHLYVDVEHFLEAAPEALREGGADLTRVIELYRGEFLPEDLYDDWASPLREEARSTCLALLRARANEAKSVEQAIAAHLRVLEIDPWDESSHQAIIAALTDAGRHGEARRALRRYQSRMQELGIPPETL